jgi:flagellar hook-basal body complex protein FliE
MTVPINNALAAYNAAAQQAGGQALAPSEERVGPSFGELLQQFGDQAIATGKEDEKQSMAASVGKANMTDVVTAVSSAELTVQTVTAVRDKVVAAYQEVLRMQI